ncbi:MAG: hypothetical protein WA790_18295 [Sulfitobacter sp.]
MQKAFNVFVRVLGFMVTAFWLMASVSTASAQSLPSMTANYNPTSVTVGNSTSLTYQITNNDTSITTDLAFTHTLPANLTVGPGPVTSSCGPSTATAPSGGTTITLANGFVERGNACSVVVPVVASTTGLFSNDTSDLTSSLGNSGPTTTGPLMASAPPATPLVLVQSVSPSSVTIGGKSTLTFTFDNSGSAIAIGSFTFNDTIPSGMTFDPDGTPTNTCANANAGFPPQFTVDYGNNSVFLNASGFTFAGFEVLAAGATCQITLPLVGSTEGSFNNASDGATYNRAGGSNLTTNTTTAAFTVTGAPADAPLMVKAFTDDPANPGGTVTARYTISNQDRNFDATDVNFQDYLEGALSGLTYTNLVSNTCGGTVPGVGTGTLSLAGGTLAAGGTSCVVTATLTTPSALAGSYPSPTGPVRAFINGAIVTGNSASDTLILRGATPPTATVNFTDSAPGGTTTMTLVITNQDSAQAITDLSYSTTFRDFPVSTANSTPLGGSCGASSSFTFNNSFNPPPPSDATPANLSVTGGSLAPGASCTLSWVLTVPSDAPGGTFSNTSDAITATVGSEPVTGGSTTGAMTVAGGLNMNFTKSFSGSVVPGGTVNVIFELGNAAESISTATAINFTDDVDAMLAGTTANVGGATNTCGGTLGGTSSVISFTSGTLAVGASCQISVPLTISAAAANGTYTNTTTPMSATPSGGTAQNYGTASADLSVFSITGTGSFTPSEVIAGETTNVAYTLTNDGADDATGVTFTFNAAEIASGTSLAAAATTNTCGGTYTLAGGGFGIYSGGTVTAGSSCVLEVPVTTSAATPAGAKTLRTSNVSATVNGSGVTFDPISAVLTIGDAAMNFGKAFSPASAPAGSVTTLTFTVENTNTSTGVTNLEFTDNLDTNFLTGATVLGQASNGCNGTLSGIGTGLMSYAGGTVAAGGTCSVAITVQLPASAVGSFQNVSSDVTGQISGLNVRGDAARATLNISSSTPPTFVKSFAPEFVDPNSTTVVSYTITNPAAGGSLSGLQFSDEIGTAISGATLTYPSTSGVCGAGSTVSGGSTLLMSGGNLAPGESCTFTATVNIPLISAGTITSTSGVLRDNGLQVAAAASDNITITQPLPDFAQAFAPTSIVQGGVSTLTYTVDNSVSADIAGSLSFTANFPTGLTIASTPNASTTCGGMGNATGGATSFSYSGGTAAAGATCTVQFDVTSQTVGGAELAFINLSSTAGASTAARATLTVTAAPTPGFTSVFSPATVDQGNTSTLTYTVDNGSALIAASALDFATGLPAGMIVADIPNASTTCTAGTLTSVAASGSVAYTGGSVAAGASCTVQVDVRATGSGSLTATSGNLTSSLNDSGTAAATLTVNAAPAPGFTKVFTPASIVQGEQSSLVLTINNSGSAIEATALDFTDTFPAGLTVATSPGASTTCTGGTVTAVSGGNSVSYTGGTIAAGASCTVSLNVTSATSGAAVNTSGDLTSSLGNSGTASDTLTVNAAPAPAFSAVFAPDNIAQGGTSTLTFSIDSSTSLIDVTALDFTNTFPAGVTIASTPNASTTCTSGTLTATAGAGSIGYTGGTVLAGASCTVQLDVTSATSGAAVNTSGDLTSSQGNSGTASDTLTVTAAPAPGFSMSVAPSTINQGAVTTVTFNVDNSGSLVSADTLGFDFALPAGVDFAPTLNFSSDCVGGVATPNAGGARLTSTTLAAGASCSAQFDVTASNAGSTVFTTGDLTSSLGNSGSASATLSVTAAGVPNFSAGFAPASIVQGGVSTLTFAIDNSANLVAAQSGAFSNTFPAGMTVAATPNFAASCTGTSTVGTDSFTAGGNSLAISGIEIGASATCSYAIDVTTATSGSSVNTSGDLVTSIGNSGPAAAVLSVSGAPIPDFTGTYLPDTIVQGESTVLVYIIDNATSLIEASGLGFTSRLPAGVTVASPLMADTTCTGGSVNANSGDTGFVFSGGTVAAGDNCSVSVGVTATTAGVGSETSSVLSTSQGDTATGVTATLTVTGAPLPTFTAAYTPATMIQGDFTTLVYTISNTAALVDATNLAFAETLPAGVTVSATPTVNNECGGTLTAAAGSTSISYTAGTVAAGAQCVVQFDVTSATVGNVNGTAGPLTSSLGDSGTAASTLSVVGAQTPLFAKAFAPATIVQGDVSTLTFTIDNSAALVDATTLSFTDPMPGGMIVATTPNITNSCTGGSVTAAAGSSSIVLAGATVDASASCTISVDVTRADAGTVTNVTGDLTSSLGNSGTATDALTTTAATAPSFAKAFAPATIVQGGVSTLTFTIDNATALVDGTALAFSDNMPSGMIVAATPNITNTCTGGTLTAAAGSSSITLAGATVAASASCAISVDVTQSTAGTSTNVTGDLTSSLGNSGTATDALTTTAAAAPSFVKAFSPTGIVQGEVSTLTFTIDNASALVDATALSFSDNMPSGMTVATTPNVTNTCSGGSVTAAAGSSSINLAGATLAAAANCTVSVDVTLTTAGAATNVTGDLTSSLGNSGTATATLTATGATAPTFAKAFSPSSIAQGEVSTLTFTINNAAAAVDATALAFSDTFPTGMTIASTPNASSTCSSGSLSAAAGAGVVTYSGGTVASGASCLVSVNVTASIVQSYANTSGDLTSSLGNSGTASASLSVTSSSAPGFSGSYSPPSIPQGGTSRLSLTINNSANSVPAGSLGFNVSLPSGVTIDNAPSFTSLPAASSTCGGSVTAVGGATSVSLSGGSVAAGSTCTVSVNVTSQNVGTVGAISGSLTSSLGGTSVAAGAPLVVVVNPQGRVTFVQNTSEDGTFTFSSTEALLNFGITTAGGSGSRGPIDLTQGTYIVTQSRPEGIGNTAFSCSDNDSVGDLLSGTLTLNLGPNESVTCTYSSINTSQKTSEVIHTFLQRRNNLILSNGPTKGRRLARLSRGMGGSETLSFQRGNLKSFAPVNFNLLSAGSGNYEVSTSLYQVERSALMFALAHDGIDGSTAVFQPRRFDVWLEAHYNEYKASQGSSGHFGIAYLGADYLITPDLLAGVMLQFDSLDDESTVANSTISGKGWMIGPYVTARVAPNLIFDGRISYGQSTNKVSPTNTYTDEFDTDRFLIDASLSGNFDWDKWVVTPTLSISYIEERQHEYIDSNSNVVGKQKVSLGQIKFGPTFSTTIEGNNHSIIEPSFGVNGIYNFASRSGANITNNTADETNGLRARVEAAVRVTNRHGTRFEFGANYDGIGQNEFESWGANLKLTIPLQ